MKSKISSQTAIFLFGVSCLLVLYAIAAYDYFYGQDLFN